LAATLLVNLRLKKKFLRGLESFELGRLKKKFLRGLESFELG